MRETLDCGVLMVPPHHGWVHEWIGRHGQALGRLRLYPVHFDDKTLGGPPLPAAPAAPGAPPAAEVLARLAIPLRRYDVCVLPVSPATVAWTRTALACARAQLHTPLLALARGLKAAAIQDLLLLGLHDFALHRAGAEELRARLSHLAGAMPRLGEAATPYLLRPPEPLAVADAMVGYGVAGVADAAGRPQEAAPEWPASTPRGTGSTAAAGARGRRGDPRAVSFLDEIAGQRGIAGRADADGTGARRLAGAAGSEPFRVAKSRVVGCFERDYVRTALSRHGGNVASAARASAKHRRAFWALMRKHAIDAGPYRAQEDDEDGG